MSVILLLSANLSAIRDGTLGLATLVWLVGVGFVPIVAAWTAGLILGNIWSGKS